MATKNQKLDSYIIRYHNLNEPAQYDMRVSVPRSFIRCPILNLISIYLYLRKFAFLLTKVR